MPATACAGTGAVYRFSRQAGAQAEYEQIKSERCSVNSDFDVMAA